MLTAPARLLSEADRGEVERLLDREPIAGAQVAERLEAGGLTWWRTGARVFGYGPPGGLESLCWLGANLIPVAANPAVSPETGSARAMQSAPFPARSP